MADWNWIADSFFINAEAAQFYFPIISDPAVSATMYAGTGHVWRTKTQGVGAQSVSAFRANCNEFTGVFNVPCGDWAPLGDPSAAGQLIGNGFGPDPARGNGRAGLRPTATDSSAPWAATAKCRVFVSKNADEQPATSVAFRSLY